jgi:DNA-binding MarR family transcriptional regulator
MYAVRVTPEGKRILEKASPIALNVDAAVLQGLTTPERETFNSLLQKVMSQSDGVDEQV